MNKTVQGTDKDGNKIEMNVEKLFFRPSIYGVLIKENKVLLISQNFGYSLPGGGIELGENHKDALVRELEEETGYKITVDKILDIYSSFFKLPFSGRNAHTIRLFFSCSIVGGGLIENPDLSEAEKSWNSKPEWIELSKLNEIKIGDSADIVGIINKALT